MRQLCVIAAIFAVLRAGGECSNLVRENTVDKGGSFPVFIASGAHSSQIVKCRLYPPHEPYITFAPNNQGDSSEKYRIDQSIPGISDCAVTVLNVTPQDEGIWRLTYEHNGEDDARVQEYKITVNVADAENTIETEDENVTLLSVIYHHISTESAVDISLSNNEFEEECYVRPPGGELINVNHFTMENVTVQRSSELVSCRITLGPISEDMLGEWRLCGKTLTEEMRCQPANITYNNNNPKASWASTTRKMFNHPVHFGGSVTSGIPGIGNIITCHVITPNGEDLVLTSDVKYPHLERIEFKRSSLCAVKFSDINAFMLGNWTLYGKFRSATSGLNEARLPLNFSLYNADDPFEQAYNVTTSPAFTRVVNLGAEVTTGVGNNAGQVDNCQVRTPSGELYSQTSPDLVYEITLINEDVTPVCKLVISPVTEKLAGEWQIIGKFSNGNQFTEIRQTFFIVLEDPTNPIIEEDRTIENMTELTFISRIGETQEVTIGSAPFVQPESCHILTPNGLQHSLIDGFNIPHVEIVNGTDVECGVAINVHHDTVGEWTLISRATRLSVPIERRQPFTIRVEESTAEAHVNPLRWALGSTIDITHGPQEVVYCQVRTPKDEIIFDGFGPCKIHIDKVTRSHRGLWVMMVVLPDAIVAVRQTFNVKVYDRGLISGVNTSVERNAPSVILTCSVNDHFEVQACKFRDPSGNIFVASQTHTLENNYESNITPHSCSLRLTSPTVSDLGLWRCGVDTTDDGTHYGFLNVTCPRLMQDPAVAARVVTEPVLKSEQAEVSVMEGGAVQMRCSVDSVILYCYFRAQNGTTYAVGPATSSPDYEYVGSGLDAGECGIRFRNLQVNDTGAWSCHVGLHDASAPEQRANFQVNVQVRMAAAAYWIGTELAVRARVYNTTLDYCRFVRIDGTGFTAANAPAPYEVENFHSQGICSLLIHNAAILERHPWTIAAKIAGQDGEIFMMTTEDLLQPELTPPGISATCLVFIWIFVTFLGVLLISVGVALVPKNNREWTYARAARVRDSFRKNNSNVQEKQPSPYCYDNPVVNTQQSA